MCIAIAASIMLSTSACSTSNDPDPTAITTPDCAEFNTQYWELLQDKENTWSNFNSEPTEIRRNAFKTSVLTLANFMVNDSTGCASPVDKAKYQATLDQLN